VAERAVHAGRVVACGQGRAGRGPGRNKTTRI